MTIVIDAQMGVSGDMFLGALWDLGLLDRPAAADAFSRLANVAGAGPVRFTRTERAGVVACRCEFESQGDGWSAAKLRARVVEAADALGLGPGKDVALRALDLILKAESHVHLGHDHLGPDGPCLHETGSPDTVVDLVGAGLLYERSGLDRERVLATAVSMGGGTKRISHGWVSIPAPATLAIMAGHPVRYGPVELELATPTGAALLRAMAGGEARMNEFTVRRIGLGAGAMDVPGVANVLRIMSDREAPK